MPPVLDGRSVLQRLFDQRDAEAAETAAAGEREDRLDKYLPKHLLARRERQERVDAGEDPRVTEYYDAQEKLSGSSHLAKYLPKELIEKRRSLFTERFFRDNQDLDPRKTATTEKNDAADKAVQAVLRLVTTEGKMNRQLASDAYNRLKPQITPELRKKYDLDRLENEGVFTHVTGIARAYQAAPRPVQKAMGALDRPSKRALATIGNVRRGRFGDAAENILTGPADLLPQGMTRGFGAEAQLDKAGLDKNEDGHVDAREAFGINYRPKGAQERSWKGFGQQLLATGVGALDTAAVIGTDPTTYLTLGSSAAVKSGLRSLERQGQAQLAKSLRREGIKGMDDAQRATIYQAILKDKTEAITKGATKKTAKAADKAGGTEALIEKSTEKTFGKLEKGGRSGVKLAGRTVAPYKPFAKGHVGSSTERVVRSIRGSDIVANDVMPRLGNAEVLEIDEASRLVTVQPADTMVVSRKGVTETVQLSDVKVGDSMYDGDAVVKFVDPASGTMGVELKNTLWHGERQLDVMPQAGTGGQGRLLGTKEAPADTQGKMFGGDVARGGGLTGDLTDPSRQLSRPGAIDDAIRRVKDPELTPPSTGGGGFATAAEKQIPKTPGTHVVPDGSGGHFIGIRGADGSLKGYAMLTDDAISIFEAVAKGERIGDALLDAIDEAGLDTVAKLANSDFTKDGRKAALRWLEAKKAGAPKPTAARLVEQAATEGRQPRASLQVILPSGGKQTHRVWRTDRASGQIGLPVGSRVEGLGEVVSASVDDAGNVSMVFQPDVAMQVGEDVGQLFGKVSAVNPDGTVTIVPSRAMTPSGNIATTKAPSEKPVAAADTLPGMDVPTNVPDEQVARLGDELEPLSDADAYSPGATTESVISKIVNGSPVAQPGAVDTPLFSWGSLTPGDFGKGDRIRPLKSVVLGRIGRNKLLVRPDNVPLTVRRADFLGRMDHKDIGKGDVLEDMAKVIKVNDDGTLVIRTLEGGVRSEDVLTVGGTPLTDSVRRARVERRAATVRGALQPRGAILAAERTQPSRVTPGSAERYYAGTSLGQGQLAASIEALHERIGGARVRLRKALGKEAAEVLTEAFDVSAAGITRGGKTTRQIIDSFRAQGDDVIADALEVYDTVARDIVALEKSVKAPSPERLAGIADEATEAGQLPLVVTRTGREALKMDPTIRNFFTRKHVENLSLGFDFGESVRGRVLRIEDPELATSLGIDGSFVEIRFDGTVREIEDQLVDIMDAHTRQTLRIGGKKGKKIFEHDPTAIFFMRGQSAARSAAEGEMLRYLAEPFGDSPGLIRFIKDGDQVAIDQAAHEGLDQVAGFESPLGRVYAHREIAGELKESRKMFTDEVLANYDKALRWYSNFLARYQTSAITKGTAFPARNEFGNIWVNTMQGVGPQYVTEAAGVMNAARKIRKIMRETGVHWEEAVTQAKGVSQRHINALKLIQDNSITRSGFFRNASWDEASKKASRAGQSKLAAIRHAANPFDQDSILTRPGRALNQALEDHSRIAHFLAKIDSLGDIHAARESVRTYLFDYADLTPWEQQVAKRFNRFYTYMRKNMAMQAGMIAHYPGRTKTAFELKNALMDETQSALLYPGEDKEGSAPAGDFLRKILGGGTRGVVKIETPLDAAFGDIDPMAQIAYSFIPGLKDTLPPGERPTKQEAIGGLLGYTAGGPVELVTTIYEFNTGVDTYTGRPLDDNEGEKFLFNKWGDATDTNKKLVDLIAPAFNQGVRTTGAVKGQFTGEKDATELIRLLAGIAYSKREGEEEQASLAYAQLRELDKVIARLRDQGVEVPTMEELRTARFLPELETSKARTVKLTPEMRRAEARKKIVIGG